jgi:hypothetical protein
MSKWKPLIVSHGFGCTKIDTPLTAVIFLENLPGAKREEMLFDVTYNACKRAARGESEPSSAFKVFETWARSTGRLLPLVEEHLMAGAVRAAGGMPR